MSKLFNLKVAARQEAHDKIVEITNRAADEDRDMTKDEDETCEELRTNRSTLDGQIKVLKTDNEAADTAPEPVAKRDTDTRGESATRGSDVKVTKDPGPYGDGPAGFRRFLLDQAVLSPFASNKPTGRGYTFNEAQDRLETFQQAARSGDDEVALRAVATTNLPGIVNPQFDPSMISRGVYDIGVTVQSLRQYPIFAEGMSITCPRVTTKAVAAIQATEGSAFNDTSVATSGVEAKVFTVSAKMEVSVQSIERGNMSAELLQDELRRSWMEQLNNQILYGDNDDSNSKEPPGLLRQVSATTGQFIESDKASATAQLQLGYLTALKVAVWKANRRRVNKYIVGPDAMGDWEDARTTNGDLLLPPQSMWVQNQGGSGGLPEMEGIKSDADWRKVPIVVDPEIGHTFNDTGAVSGGTQTRYIGLCSDDVPVFYDGPMTYTYEQTKADEGDVLLVVRGYAAFNPFWRPESWRIIYGTGTLTV